MHELICFLLGKYNIFLAGLEKSGAFVEHADEISGILKNGKFLILDNEYIYKYILLGKADSSNPYGGTTYYSNKLIFKTSQESVYVVSVPTKKVSLCPTYDDLPNIDIILTNIEKLKCDMYDNSLFPIALVNRLVSLSDHPSSRILKKFE